MLRAPLVSSVTGDPHTAVGIYRLPCRSQRTTFVSNRNITDGQQARNATASMTTRIVSMVAAAKTLPGRRIGPSRG